MIIGSHAYRSPRAARFTMWLGGASCSASLCLNLLRHLRLQSLMICFEGLSRICHMNEVPTNKICLMWWNVIDWVLYVFVRPYLMLRLTCISLFNGNSEVWAINWSECSSVGRGPLQKSLLCNKLDARAAGGVVSLPACLWAVDQRRLSRKTTSRYLHMLSRCLTFWKLKYSTLHTISLVLQNASSKWLIIYSAPLNSKASKTELNLFSLLQY